MRMTIKKPFPQWRPQRFSSLAVHDPLFLSYYYFVGFPGTIEPRRGEEGGAVLLLPRLDWRRRERNKGKEEKPETWRRQLPKTEFWSRSDGLAGSFVSRSLKGGRERGRRGKESGWNLVKETMRGYIVCQVWIGGASIRFGGLHGYCRTAVLQYLCTVQTKPY